MKKHLSFHSFSLPFTPRYSLIILSLFTFCFSLSQAQTYVGTMKMGKEVQKDVWVKCRSARVRMCLNTWWRSCRGR